MANSHTFAVPGPTARLSVQAARSNIHAGTSNPRSARNHSACSGKQRRRPSQLVFAALIAGNAVREAGQTGLGFLPMANSHTFAVPGPTARLSVQAARSNRRRRGRELFLRARIRSRDPQLARVSMSRRDSVRSLRIGGLAVNRVVSHFPQEIDTTISQVCSSGSVYGWINYRSRKIRLG